MTTDRPDPVPAKQALDTLSADIWDALAERDPYHAISGGRQVTRYPRGDLAEAEAVAAAARARRERLDRIDIAGLGRTDRLTVEYLRYWLDDEMNEPQRWWTSFGVAPYTATILAVLPDMIFTPIDVSIDAEAARYVKLAGELASHVEAHRERVLAQAERGWRLPRPALPNTRRTLQGLAAVIAGTLRLDDRRGATMAVRADVEAIVSDRLNPAFAALVDAIGPDYEGAAPDAIGLVHQPGGADAYRMWIRYHVGYDADPAELHRIGLAEVGELAAEMARVRAERFGHAGDEASFHEKLNADPAAKAPSAEALEATYRRHLQRMEPVFARLFRKAPRSRGILKRLAPELEAGMTFGYYDQPKAPGGDGVYHYSGNGIPDRLQMNAAALIFHELVPGHHVHIARQIENRDLPDLRRVAFAFNGFNEGWAEYASGLAEAEGLYDDPYDYYGFLAHQRFVAQRLVVDTGLNALGWTMDAARAYMRANTLEKPEQVTSEILRYGTDMPGQALCYRMGYRTIRALRAQAEQRLGDRFDLADFHEAILEQGALPLSVLERSIREWTDQVAA
jgi:uncharacterized protein (DUF885 family)